ncbi:hypothetical protein ATANTOWER_020548, partial [Ataeniobius toweri]|nr:hypothetical protein [Ataeniobius toweri]
MKKIQKEQEHIILVVSSGLVLLDSTSLFPPGGSIISSTPDRSPSLQPAMVSMWTKLHHRSGLGTRWKKDLIRNLTRATGTCSVVGSSGMDTQHTGWGSFK